MPIDYTMDTIVDEVIDYSIILLDINGNLLTWNLGAKRLYGFSKAEIYRVFVDKVFYAA